MWDRKLYDEMFYGVILFRCVSCYAESRKGKYIEIDLWDKRVNRNSKKPNTAYPPPPTAMNVRLIFLDADTVIGVPFVSSLFAQIMWKSGNCDKLTNFPIFLFELSGKIQRF